MRFLATLLGVLAAAAAVSAQVLPSTHLSGRVVDERTRLPIPGARVSLSSESGNALVPLLQQTITDQDGRYIFEGVAAGQYRVDVRKSGILPLADALLARTVTVRDGQAVEDWNISVQRGGAIAGRILDQFGEPLPDATIRAVRQDKGGAPYQYWVRGVIRSDPSDPRFLTNDLGEFRLYGLVPGEYVLSAERPKMDGYRNIAADMTLRDSTYYPGVSEVSAAQVITVSAGETASGVEFRMLTNPGFTLAGVIVDQAGTPVKGMMVLLRADAKFDANGKVTEGPVGVSSSDANGRFVLGNVASGLYHISVDSTDAALRKAMLDGSVRSYIVTEGGPPAAGVDPMAVTVKDAIVDDLRIVLQSLQSR